MAPCMKKGVVCSLITEIPLSLFITLPNVLVRLNSAEREVVVLPRLLYIAVTDQQLSKSSTEYKSRNCTVLTVSRT